MYKQLSHGCIRQRGGRDSNPLPVDRKSGSLYHSATEPQRWRQTAKFGMVTLAGRGVFLGSATPPISRGRAQSVPVRIDLERLTPCSQAVYFLL